MLAWGIPHPSKDGRKPKPVTNVCNTASPFWRSMLATPERRCRVRATAFSEWTDSPDPATGRNACKWFEVADAESFCFAGRRPIADGERFAFLTTEPNAIVAPVHAKAMPVLLRTEDHGRWLTGDYAAACALQKPLDDGALRIRAEGLT